MLSLSLLYTIFGLSLVSVWNEMDQLLLNGITDEISAEKRCVVGQTWLRNVDGDHEPTAKLSIL